MARMQCALNILINFVLLPGLIFAPQFAEVQKPASRVEIHIGWGGLGTPQNADITIRRKDGAFVCDGNAVDAAKVRALVSALESPPLAKPEMENLGITPAW